MGHVRFGFAAGCAAVALCPADSSQIILVLCPWSGLSPIGFIGPKAAPRAYPKNVRALLRRRIATPRTSGGKAEVTHQRSTFRANLFKMIAPSADAEQVTV
jgi:hypothetical protein